MLRLRNLVVAAAALVVACSVGALDFTGKTCGPDQTCPAGLVCDTTHHCVGAASVTPPAACTAKTCDELGAQCEGANDGCNNFINCGDSCAAFGIGLTCIKNKCECVPRTCAQADAECGEIKSPCGTSTTKCPDCPAAKPFCSGSGPTRCGTTPCTPKTCADLGARCGSIGDGCGQVIPSCGTCTSPETCGGGGVANQCGCTPKTCAQAGWQCGTGANECGQPRDCGGCDPGKTCDAHKCVCRPTQTCEGVGWECGTGTVCGVALTCAVCPQGKSCVLHRCVS